ncbi:adenosine receptor A2b-like [Thalassophryne amazonica]|uniref:adenosine receptor A2b-like n=1 Tax=Thalassophryne amazonica TaxID=390379 RepID=UPI0014721A56|nr:adenosine receptor A2b-like [Thalassophryne amazonica]
MLKDSQLVYMGLELMIACLAVAGNVLVCWAVYLNSNLQSITNFFVVSLAVADIAVGLLAIPFAITISTGFCSNFYGCLFIACFVLVLTQSSIFSLLAIAVDRYIAIKNPLRYNSLVTGRRAKGIIALCWVLSVGIGLTPMVGWNTGANTTSNSSRCPEGMTQCLFEGVVTLDYMVYFNFFGCVLVPLVAMLVIYINIFMAARHQLQLIGLKVAQTPSRAVATLSLSSSRSTLQKEVHAAKSLAIIVGLFAFCWLPVHIINCFNYLCQDCSRSHIWVMNIAIILSHANSVVNPFIYAYHIREFRLTFRRIMHQHILGHKTGHGFGVGSSNDRNDGSSSITRTSFHISKDGSSCSTVVNSYVLDSSPDLNLPAHKGSSNQRTTMFDPSSKSYTTNGHHISALSPTKQQPGIMEFAIQVGQESTTYFRGTTHASRIKDSGSGISFVNVCTLSPTQTHTVFSAELQEAI